MVERKPKKILPTMKVNAKDENDIAFKPVQVIILDIKDVGTKKYGNKIVAEVQSSENQEMQFNIFLNNYSIENLNEAYGSNDRNWIGKSVNLEKEVDKIYDNEMIVVLPIK